MRSTTSDSNSSSLDDSLHTRRSAAATPAPVELHVADLDASESFYTGLLGLVKSPTAAGSPDSRTLVSPEPSSAVRCLILTKSASTTASNALLLELESAAELLDRYLIAKLLNAPLSPLATSDGCLCAVIRDPDGHRIELRSTETPPQSGSSAATAARASGGSPRRSPGRDAGRTQPRSSRSAVSPRPASDDPSPQARHSQARGNQARGVACCDNVLAAWR